MYHFLIDRERVDDFVLLDEDANRVVDRVRSRALLLKLQPNEGNAHAHDRRPEPNESSERGQLRLETLEVGEEHFLEIML
jgi:hypothetical protein